jgi:hypothetical protein
MAIQNGNSKTEKNNVFRIHVVRLLYVWLGAQLAPFWRTRRGSCLVRVFPCYRHRSLWGRVPSKCFGLGAKSPLGTSRSAPEASAPQDIELARRPGSPFNTTASFMLLGGA